MHPYAHTTIHTYTPPTHTHTQTHTHMHTSTTTFPPPSPPPVSFLPLLLSSSLFLRIALQTSTGSVSRKTKRVPSMVPRGTPPAPGQTLLGSDPTQFHQSCSYSPTTRPEPVGLLLLLSNVTPEEIVLPNFLRARI